jgi:hypothetical protein
VLGVGENAVGYLFAEAGINPALISKRAFLTSSNPASDFTGPAGSGVAAVSAPLADPAGYVYVDQNGNGKRDYPESGIPNVEIVLRGTTSRGESIEHSTRTASDGFYQFAFLPPGTYSLHETQPNGYADGRESLGSLGGRVGNDRFTNIVLRDGDVGVDYNFGELPLGAVPTGDSNQDGVFNSSDLILVFQAGEYEDAINGNSTFAEGDWNGDGDFNSSDLVLAFQRGNYVNAAHDSIFAELGERRMSREAKRKTLRHDETENRLIATL